MNYLLKNKADIWYFGLALCIFLYLFLRAFFVPVLHDEVSTFYIYIESGNFLPWKAWPDANNHFLNSFLSWLMYKLFGSEVWILRLPNVLSSIIFFISVVGISHSLRDKYFRHMFVIVLFLTHGFVEFFAFARGYGISMAFIMLAIWMILLAERKKNIRFAAFALLSCIPAVMANLTLLPSAGIISAYLIIFLIQKIRNQKNTDKAFFLGALILFAVVFIYAAMFSMMLKGKDLLYYGGEEGFYNAILKTHSKMLFINSGNILIIYAIAVFVLGVVAFFIEYLKNGKKESFLPSRTLFPALMFGALFTIIFMHFYMNVNYPEDRTSMYLYPYFVGFVFFTADSYRRKNLRWMIVPFFLYVPLNFIFHINIAYSFHWHYERISPVFADIVKENSGAVSPGNVTISGYKIYELIWGHHVRFKVPGVNLMNPANYPNNIDDFVLLRKEERDTMNSFFADYEILAEDPYSQIQLLKRKVFSDRHLLFESIAVDNPVALTGEYLNFFSDTVFDFAGKSLLFQFDIQFDSPAGADGCVIVVSVRDSLYNNLQYQRIETSWLSDKPVNDFSYSLSVMKIHENSAGLLAYIWNKNKKELKISHAKVAVFEYGSSSGSN